MNQSQFIRTFQMRAPNLMWFLGAGASAAAGIPTAGNMIWEFKRTIYCSRQGVSIQQCANMADPGIKRRLQYFFDSAGGFPPQGACDEYPAYFEAAYPSEADRQKYIEQRVAQGRPSFGHKVLAALMYMGRTRIVWTTNFDDLVELSLNHIGGEATRYTTATLDAGDLALEALNDQRYPLIVKLHGDYRSRRLKNSQKELDAQDALLRHTFVEACKRFGLIVVGYSGRDDSIMLALEEAIRQKHAFPKGLYWLTQAGTVPSSRVERLIDDAKKSYIESDIVEISSFDEVMDRAILVEKDVPTDLLRFLLPFRERTSDVPLPKIGSETWPVLRLNALPVVSVPQECYLIECEIGGTAEVRDAIEHAASNVVAVRSARGVLAFGSVDELRRVFSQYHIANITLRPIDRHALRDSINLRGFATEALARAIARVCSLDLQRRRSSYILTIPGSSPLNQYTQALEKCVGGITGTISNTNTVWTEGILLRIDYALDATWLLLKPVMWIVGEDELPEEHKEIVSEFVRERLATRYNRIWNNALNAWIDLLTVGRSKTELRLFDQMEPGDAVFTVGKRTAFSHRGKGV